MFHFPHFASIQPMCSAGGVLDFIETGCPIRESPAKLVWQLIGAFRSRTTPFIGP